MSDWKIEDLRQCKESTVPGSSENFVGREDILEGCRACWGLGPNYEVLDGESQPLHFRLEGPPGVGKNEIVYELVRRMRTSNSSLPFYMIQGHEELTPEDLAILIVPTSDSTQGFAMQASPLATAIQRGGVFFFDEISRVPERALSPLSGVLDDRVGLYSSITGFTLDTRNAEYPFRFCCALNPGMAGYRLPEYIEQRTLPVFTIPEPDLEDLVLVLKRRLDCEQKWLDAYRNLHLDVDLTTKMSARQTIALVRYATQIAGEDSDADEIMKTLVKHFIRID